MTKQEVKRRRAEFVDQVFAGTMLGMMPRSAEYVQGAPITPHDFVPIKEDPTACEKCGCDVKEHQ